MTEKRLNSIVVPIESNNSPGDFFCCLKIVFDVRAKYNFGTMMIETGSYV